MNFVAHQAQDNEYYETASNITEIFAKHGAIDDFENYYSIYRTYPTNFRVDHFEISNPDNTETTIAVDRWAGDSEDRYLFTIPTEWMDNFDEAVVTEEAKKRIHINKLNKEMAFQRAYEKQKQKELDQLKELISKHGVPK